MATTYTYTVSVDFAAASEVNLAALQEEIKNDGTVVVDPDYIIRDGDDVKITFPSSLTAGQKTGLDTLVSNYTYVQNNLSDIFISDQKSTATNGGTFTGGAWQTRDLNTITSGAAFATLASNQFTLIAGQYLVDAEAPASRVYSHQIRLRNITDSTTDGVGSCSYSSGNIMQKSRLAMYLNLSSSKTFEIQHRCSQTKTTNGFGISTGFGEAEVYTFVHITKI